MTKTYSILQKKLEELESILQQTISLPAADPPNRRHHSDDIEQRFVFLNNLLAAEIASHPKKPQHLHHIARRLTDLDTAWNNFVTTSSSIDHLDAASSCSCTESCLNDDGEASQEQKQWSQVYDGLEILCEGLKEEKVPEKTVRVPVVTVRAWNSELGIMASGMAVGAVLMGFVMVRFFGCFNFMEYPNFVTPT